MPDPADLPPDPLAALLFSAASMHEVARVGVLVHHELITRARARTIAAGRTLVTAADVQTVTAETLAAVVRALAGDET